MKYCFLWGDDGCLGEELDRQQSQQSRHCGKVTVQKSGKCLFQAPLSFDQNVRVQGGLVELFQQWDFVDKQIHQPKVIGKV